MKIIHGAEVHGANVDFETRCAHYHSDVDIIAIKFKCCEKWFPCFECHAETSKHKPSVWNNDEHETLAVLCGGCGHQLSVAEYLECGSVCPNCRREFNPNCARHYHLYFQPPQANKRAFD
ncbi:MAG: CHY zinc finger protein [Pyrinomonadaceae bacterium]